MSRAEEILRRYNRNMLIGPDGDMVCGIEDHADSDGRMYRMEYISTPDGRRAVAYCRSNPWNRSSPNAGEEYVAAHVSSNGHICAGSESTTSVSDSPYDLDFIIRRARYWCVAFSAFKETRDRSVFNI